MINNNEKIRRVFRKIVHLLQSRSSEQYIQRQWLKKKKPDQSLRLFKSLQVQVSVYVKFSSVYELA